jgi:hypothetical protein
MLRADAFEKVALWHTIVTAENGPMDWGNLGYYDMRDTHP